jgi:hypothetical protein
MALVVVALRWTPQTQDCVRADVRANTRPTILDAYGCKGVTNIGGGFLVPVNAIVVCPLSVH